MKRGPGVGLRSSAARGLCLALLVVFAPAAAAAEGDPANGATASHWELMDRYCVECHNFTDWAGGVALDVLSQEHLIEDADVWEKAVRLVRTGLMPPADQPRPQRAALEGMVERIEAQLDREHGQRPNPGAEALSRLNRAEYRNAVRDLLAFDAGSIVDTLPADDAVAGFDNIADALSISPTLIEAYVGAAMRISRLAVGDLAVGPSQIRHEAPPGLSQDRHIDGLPLGTRGGMRFTHHFPVDAEYEFSVGTQGLGVLSGQRFCELPRVDITLNGVPLEPEDPQRFRLSVEAGPQVIGVALVDDTRCPGVNELYDVATTPGGVQYVEIAGPFDATGTGDTPSRRAIFSCHPREGIAADECAQQILTSLATRAYRHPVAADEPAVETLMRFYRSGRDEGGFEVGIQHAIARLLIDPRFIYRVEEEPEGLTPGEVYPVSDLELASRLSFFLWSSIPDAELRDVAAAGQLRDPDRLREQVLRMLEDPRAEALTKNFAGQWLRLRELRSALPQDSEFDANLREAFQLETEMLFDALVRDDRSVLDLLGADFTYLNDRLAEHYGIAGVRGSYMRRVSLPEDSPRRGLLGHGSILTATSVANRTSPVIRGEWIVENILGAHVPPPPAGVEADLDSESATERLAEARTLRERLELHLEDPSCRSCHSLIDPVGFPLEYFDLVGRWRDTENGHPINGHATMVDGTEVHGPTDLREALLARPVALVTAMTERLMTYGLGRVLGPSDMPAVRRIVSDAAAEDYRFSAIVLGIVNSDPFLKRVATGEAPVLSAQVSPEDRDER